MTGAAVLDGLCVYFGGPYDAARRLYATVGAPIIPGLFVVKRSPTKSWDGQLWDYGSTTPQATGAAMLVTVDDSSEMRVAFAGATSGVKQVAWAVEMEISVMSRARDAEDVHDFTIAMRDAMLARIRADRTCGSGGFEAGASGFQVAETAPWLRTHMGLPHTSSGVTKQTLIISTEAHQYVQA